MKAWMAIRFRAAIAAATSLTGKRFGLLVASSLVATSGIVVAAMTNGPERSPAATLLAARLAEPPAPIVAAAPPAEEEPTAEEEEPVAAAPAEPAPEAIEEVPVPEVLPEPVEEEPAPEEEAPVEEEPAPEEEPEAPVTKPPEAGRVKHVFVISLASPGYDAAFGKTPTMPYLATKLRPQGDLLAHYSVLSEAALPNGIAAIGGQPPNAETKKDCPTYTEYPATAKINKGVVAGTACVYPSEALTLPDQLAPGGFSWGAYMEGMKGETGPENCVHPGPKEAEETEPGGYSVRLNPFAFFQSLVLVGACSSEDKPITELKKALKTVEATPNFTYISPTPCSAGVVGTCAEGATEGAAAADAWLEEIVPQIMKSPAYKADGAIFVTFGTVSPPPVPVEGAPAPAANPEPLRTGALLISKFLPGESTDNADYNPYSLLRSTEELFGLGQLAKAGDAKVKSFAPELLGEETEPNGGD